MWSLLGKYSLTFMGKAVSTDLTGPPHRSDLFVLTGMARCWFYELAKGVLVYYGTF
jgi:hypothetical protein